MSDRPLIQFHSLLQAALNEGTLVKLTLGKPRNADSDLRNVFVRPVTLKRGPHFSFLHRHTTRDLTRNFPAEAALAEIKHLLTEIFFDAHLFTASQQAQLEIKLDGTARLRTKQTQSTAPTIAVHDKPRQYAISADSPWMRALGVTNERGQPREGMAGKFRQIQKFAELIAHITQEAGLPSDRPWRIADMGSGKGYLTFALAAQFNAQAQIIGIERRADLVELCNRIARDCDFGQLRFIVGDIGSARLESTDLLVALHACDTATDDALAQGIAVSARALVVSPCCQKELRQQLTAPPVLSDALRHGIFQERQAEFVTDAIRAMLLEWAGYRTKVFEFVSTEHTAKNLMLTATLGGPRHDAALAARIRAFAAFYGIKTQALATHLNFKLTTDGLDET